MASFHPSGLGPATVADPVWTVVIFDLPTTSADARSAATRFRHLLYDLGFFRIQLSIYVRYLPNATASGSLKEAIRQGVPTVGDVRILRLTDAQWTNSDRFNGALMIPPPKDEEAGEQLVLFDGKSKPEVPREAVDLRVGPWEPNMDDEWGWT